LGDIKTVWRWTGSNWQIWSPNENIMDMLSNYGIDAIETVNRGEGFWVNK